MSGTKRWRENRRNSGFQPNERDDTATGSVAVKVAVAPSGAVVVDIIYAPESDQYMPKIIEDFNTAYRNNTNPLTGEALADDEPVIYVQGEPRMASISSSSSTSISLFCAGESSSSISSSSSHSHGYLPHSSHSSSSSSSDSSKIKEISS